MNRNLVSEDSLGKLGIKSVYVLDKLVISRHGVFVENVIHVMELSNYVL